MKTIQLAHQVDFEGWRNAARALALDGTPPASVLWSVGAPADLFADTSTAAPEQQAPPPAATAGQAAFSVPRPLVELAQTVIQAREPERFALLYELIWRVRQGERSLIQDAADPQVNRAMRLAQSVRRDTHKMRAFLRFREVAPGQDTSDATRYVAWFEPDHYIVEANADFFVRRFSTMIFSILTPYRSVHWTGAALQFGPGADPSDIPDDDALERYWRAYFSAIFNPARLKLSAMTSEMPRKYWRNLPEAAAIPDLVRNAQNRTNIMLEQQPAPRTAPQDRAAPRAQTALVHVSRETLPEFAALAEQAEGCRRCPLGETASQTVFGEGPADARLMMVGEQPGDQEDLAGRPFVGPAGQLLDRALQEAGIDRKAVYVTNAVKHFKFEARGKRRIHQKPDEGNIKACADWLTAERRLVAPELLVMLGATAARAVLGRTVTISRERGRPIDLDARCRGLVTVHPSFLLRLPDEEARRREYAAFVTDLRLARSLLEASAADPDATGAKNGA